MVKDAQYFEDRIKKLSRANQAYCYLFEILLRKILKDEILPLDVLYFLRDMHIYDLKGFEVQFGIGISIQNWNKILNHPKFERLYKKVISLKQELGLTIISLHQLNDKSINTG